MTVSTNDFNAESSPHENIKFKKSRKKGSWGKLSEVVVAFHFDTYNINCQENDE